MRTPERYRLYFCPATACLAPQILLEETGATYETIAIDISQGQHRTPSFLALNPAGCVPALELPDRQVIAESAAISLYLAERHPECALAPPPDDPQRACFLHWLFYLTNTVQVAYKRFYYPERFATAGATHADLRELAVTGLAEAWRPVETHLETQGGPFLLGPAFSLGDIYMLMLTTWYIPIGDLYALFPKIGTACSQLGDRPAIRRCLDMQDRAIAEDGRAIA